VDEVAAQHVDADAMVHYGHACMSQTYRLPVVYVFGQKPIDSDDCVARLLEISGVAKSAPKGSNSKKLILFRHDVAYTHQAENVVSKLQESLEPLGNLIVYSKVPLKLDVPSASNVTNVTVNSLASDEPSGDDCIIFYVGGESLGLTNLLVTHSSCDVYSYDPKARIARLESSRTNKLLMRRYVVVQKARDADVFGILVGTLGVASYLPLIGHLRALLAQAHKKSYTITVGKLTPSKLANFMEIECFVLVACPENSLIDAKDFLRPIVTPYELEVALRAKQSWTGRYVLDFKMLMSECQEAEATDGEGSEEDTDKPIFSVVTGKYRHAKRFEGKTLSYPNLSETSSAVILRNQDDAVTKPSASAAGQFLQARTYQGLEANVGRDVPSILEQGRNGIARGYQDDH